LFEDFKGKLLVKKVVGQDSEVGSLPPLAPALFQTFVKGARLLSPTSVATELILNTMLQRLNRDIDSAIWKYDFKAIGLLQNELKS